MSRPFEGILGNTCELRILEFLLPLDGVTFNVTELSEEAGISRVTVGRVIKKFVDWGILKVHGQKVLEYSINLESPIVKSIEVLNNAIIAEMLGEEELEEISKYISERKSLRNPQRLDFSAEKYWNNEYEQNEDLDLKSTKNHRFSQIIPFPYPYGCEGTEECSNNI